MHLYYVYRSILYNYKSWIVLGICMYIMNMMNQYDLITMFSMFLCFHMFHYMSHCSFSYPFNCAHIYHHSHTNLFSNIIQIFVEFVSIVSPLFLKYIFIPNTLLLNPYIILFGFFFYTSVHSINYSLLHVNRVHEYHHINPLQNVGPDICDILFGTKYNVENEFENTDHYIPNIILSMLLVSICKLIYTFYPQKENLMYICWIIMILSILFVGVSSIYIIIYDMNRFLQQKIKAFQIICSINDTNYS